MNNKFKNKISLKCLSFFSFKNLKKILQYVGPGLIMAGTTIGVSHLFQSTRAGSSFGFQLLLLVIIVNILKYPFFEFGHRYFAATNQNLLIGYKKLGKTFLLIFFILSIISALSSLTALTFVTAGAFINILNKDLNIVLIMTIIYSICVIILFTGKYKILEKGIKTMLIVMVIFTIFAFCIAFFSANSKLHAAKDIPWSLKHLPFLIALMGWMPGPIEVSVWQSLWMEEKIKTFKNKREFKYIKFDFNLGYTLSVVMAILFLSLGALVLGAPDIHLSNICSKFVGQIVSIYTTTVGTWAGIIIAIALFITLFSTALALIDAYPRSIVMTYHLLLKKEKNKDSKRKDIKNGDCKKTLNKKIYFISLLYGFFTLIVASFFMENLKFIIDMATIIAFLSAPIFAYMNYKLIFSKNIPQNYKPGLIMKFLSHIGLIYLLIFASLYIVVVVFL